MRLPWLIIAVLCALPLWMSASESSAAAPAATPAVPATTANTSDVKSAPIYGLHRIANNLVAAEISELQGSVRSVQLLNAKPIRLREWQVKALQAQGQRPPDPDQPLHVLHDFNPQGGKHNWVRGIGLPSKDAPAWTVVSKADHALVLSYTDKEKNIAYRMIYELQDDSYALRTSLIIENNGDKDFLVKPLITPLNGIHQDDVKQDAAYLAWTHHNGGANGAMISHKLPPIISTDSQRRYLRGELSKSEEETYFPPIPSENLDYVCLKSRFFGAYWQHLKFVVQNKNDISERSDASTVPAQVTGESGGPEPVHLIAKSDKSNSKKVMATGFMDRNGGHQANIFVTYMGANNGDVVIPPTQKLDITWALTVASMKKDEVEKLGAIAAKAEYSDWYYRFFSVLANMLTYALELLVVVVINYGLAVVVLTILIKLALHRTTFKQQESMMKMQKLAPDLKLLQETYKNDKQKMAQKQMELWKKHGVNPLGGCLPILIQIPIFTALYLAFCHSADMRGHSFLWINDLTLPDQLIGWVVGGWTLSINPLPIIYIAVSVWMSLIQKIPEGGDPQQVQMMKMMRWLPVLFGVIFYNFPSGLVLYFTINAVLSTIEIKMVRRKLGMDK
jgi:YidC/Oxa1 family membrane protein insertase